MATARFKIWRGDVKGGAFQKYETEISEGMVVLDAIHQVQAGQAPDLAVRWNCKAGRCGSCSAEVNGMPRLMCMTRLSELRLDEPVTVEPMRTFPVIRDLVTDVSANYLAKKSIKKFKPRAPDAPDGTWRMVQEDVERVKEFRRCIECFLCQDVCHVLREHQLHNAFIGPRLLVHVAALEMHPLDSENRVEELKAAHGIGYCNITKCCTNVCPENIAITDNAIIPLKERVVDISTIRYAKCSVLYGWARDPEPGSNGTQRCSPSDAGADPVHAQTHLDLTGRCWPKKSRITILHDSHWRCWPSKLCDVRGWS